MAMKKYPARPKAPKAGATLSQHQNYDARMAAWASKCAEIDKANAALIAAQERTAKLKAMPAGAKFTSTTSNKGKAQARR